MATSKEVGNENSGKKRKHRLREDKSPEVDICKRRKKKQAKDAVSKPLDRLIVSVSTLDVKGQAHSNEDFSYRSVTELCRQMGATVSPQIHKRVNCLLATVSAVEQGTQRVRKALKRQIPIVNVSWVHECKSTGKRIDYNDMHRLDEIAKGVAAGATDGNYSTDTKVAPGSPIDATRESEESKEEMLPDQGWSDPLELGCCCVCHENNDDSCPWCKECWEKIAKNPSKRN